MLKILGFSITCVPFFYFYSCFDAVHGLEYGYGAHDYPTSGVFEVEPRSCPGFVFRRAVLLGSTDMSRSEVRSFMEHISEKYHGDSYHLIAKNCNHFADEVCSRLTGKPIPGWVNRLARVGKYEPMSIWIYCGATFKCEPVSICIYLLLFLSALLYNMVLSCGKNK